MKTLYIYLLIFGFSSIISYFMYRNIIHIVFAVLFIFGGLEAINLVNDYKVMKSQKEDLSEINKINYGLFNLALWKKEAMIVFENRIASFQISSEAYNEVRKELFKYLTKLNKDYIDSGKIFQNIFADAEKNEKVNKFFLKLIKENVGTQIQLLNIPQYIPGLSIQLADELKAQEPRLQDVMRKELVKILKVNENENFTDPRERIYKKYLLRDLVETNEFLENAINKAQIKIDKQLKWVFGLIAALVILSFMAKFWIGFKGTMLWVTLSSIAFLVIGITLPMIDIEGVLNAFDLSLLGTNIGFDRQYLYYQSKSILDVTTTLIRGGTWDLKLVGGMVFCFSVVFPFVKLILSILYLYSAKVSKSKSAKNMIFYLGKWSMADVFVVALFMAYIGFYGIISSQLSSIARNQGGFAIETINNSKLAPGALFFTTYCLLSIIIGIMINRHDERKMI